MIILYIHYKLCCAVGSILFYSSPFYGLRKHLVC